MCTVIDQAFLYSLKCPAFDQMQSLNIKQSANFMLSLDPMFSLNPFQSHNHRQFQHLFNSKQLSATFSTLQLAVQEKSKKEGLYFITVFLIYPLLIKTAVKTYNIQF